MQSEPSADPIDELTAANIAEWVDGYTMLSEIALAFTIEQTLAAVERYPGSAIVECGVWRGGCSTAMLLAQRAAFGRVVSPVWMLDSFEGLPAADDPDGPLAKTWQADTESPGHYDNCAASLAEVQAGLDRFGFKDGDVVLVPGWFSETVSETAARLEEGGIALLRLDGDWYESTKTCLAGLEPHVKNEGVVLIDDYYAWDGCARAVHEYLATNDLAYRIRSLPDFAGAYFEKRAARTDPDRV
jgi:O-methyltransferase